MGTPEVGINIFSPTGSGPQQGPENTIFTTKYPFAKLDTQLGIDTTQNPPTAATSFQNIEIFFNTDPPFSAGTTIVTPVHKFRHGYKTAPTYWLLYQNNNGTNTSASFTYGEEGSTILATTVLNFAELLVTVDDTYFTISVSKQYDGVNPQANIVGYTIKLRIYIFVEPVLYN